MHLLSGIVHDGKFPAFAPEWIPINLNSWEKFDPENLQKNLIRIESLESNEITHEKLIFSEERKNIFYVFNELVEDLEKDRKSFCESRKKVKKSEDLEKFPMRNVRNMDFLGKDRQKLEAPICSEEGSLPIFGKYDKKWELKAEESLI